MTAFDKLAVHEGDEEWLAWLKRVFSVQDDIVSSVRKRRQGCQNGK
jgi:hypothetical protein